MELSSFKNQAFSSLFYNGIFGIIIGILGLINLDFMILYIVYMIAFFFLLSGFFTLYMGVKFSKKEGFHHGLYIFMGLTQLLLALSLIAFPLVSGYMVFVYIAVFLLIKGSFIIINIISHKKAFPVLASASLSTGIIDLLFGLVLIIMPFISTQFLLMVLAWYFIFSGVNSIASAFTLKKELKD